MSVYSGDSDIEEDSSLESQPLLSSLSRPTSVCPSIKHFVCPSFQYFCIRSKAACVILLCTVIVGFVHFVAVNAALQLLTEVSPLMVIASSPFVVLYSLVAFVLIFYPVNGFLADVCCGRYKTIAISLSLILCSVVIALVPIIFHFFLSRTNLEIVYVLAGFALLTVTIGIAGYGSNFIQFGLDQLLEAPNQQQALFVHWANWCYDLLSTVVVGFAIYVNCSKINLPQRIVIVGVSVLFVVGFLCVLLVYVSYHKRQLYHIEPKQRNPYKVVIKILNFAIKNKRPLLRSAFTYCDDEMPSRFDFAKERFGGPFSTEQVEDVKTFLRIVVVLLTLGPIFMMELLPSNAILRYYIGLHIALLEWEHQCTWKWIVMYSGLLRYCVSTIVFPFYMWIVFSLLRNRVPKMFSRLGFGISLYFLGTVCLLVVELAGHGVKNTNETNNCIFNTSHNGSHSYVFPLLGMHWSVLIPFDILIGIGPTVVTVTILEFISAQSPRSMKGLLFGLFFAIRGIFQLVASITLTPFASVKIWSNMHISRKYPSPMSCLSWYLLFTCFVSLLGIILFLIVARNYKYRERDDKPYDQRFVVDFYSRAIESREKDA